MHNILVIVFLVISKLYRSLDMFFIKNKKNPTSLFGKEVQAERDSIKDEKKFKYCTLHFQSHSTL